MSNLTEAKGVKVVCDVFEALYRDGHDRYRLILAGPATDATARAAIAKLTASYGEAVEYRGPVHGDAKDQFFADIDCFLFPSRYKHETQGIVNLEALSHGVPVIAYAKGCISHDLSHDTVCVVPLSQDFRTTAEPVLRRWLADPASLTKAKQRAALRFEELQREAESQYAALLPAFEVRQD